MEKADLNIETKLLTLKNELKSYFEKKTEGAVIRSKAKWIHEAERNTRYVFILEKRNYINKSIQSLVTDNGLLVSEFKDVLNEQLNFYSSRYSSRETVESWDSELVDQFFINDNNIPKLDEEERIV
jgi:hypothetical protein